MIAERMVACPSRAARAAVMDYARRWRLPVRPGMLGDTPLALVTSDADRAYVLRHVVADETPAPVAFMVIP